MAIDTRIYIVGDIHGCLSELLDLEAQIHNHAAERGEEPFVLAVGDLVDRGPKSFEVVERFRKGVAAGTHEAVLGNHDVMFMDALAAMDPGRIDRALLGSPWPWWLRKEPPPSRLLVFNHWYTQGGAESLGELGPIDLENPFERVPLSAIRFFSERPIWWGDDELMVTHALASAEDIAAILSDPPDYDAFMNVIWNRRIPDAASWPMHVSGHTPLREVRDHGGTVMIDTACVYGGSLTALHPASGTLLNVPRGLS